jgi:uncharacterized protein (UPF0335 family)|tara:strand:+ start:1348 stop:1590 length:243 start_codon:yes stop_codon:yes gene_type:complete
VKGTEMTNEFESTVKDFMTRLMSIESEMETLREDRKALMEEFKSQLDTKAFKAALSIYKIRLKNVDATNTIEQMLDILEA